MRRADGLPSGGYDRDTIGLETERVFDHDWAGETPPVAADLVRFALPSLPAGLRGHPIRPGA